MSEGLGANNDSLGQRFVFSCRFLASRNDATTICRDFHVRAHPILRLISR